MKRRAQYKKIKEWILEIRKKLLSSGTRMEEDIAEKVTMVTVTKQNSSNTGESYRHNEYRNNRNNRPTRDGQGQRRERQEPSGPPVTEFAFC